MLAGWLGGVSGWESEVGEVENVSAASFSFHLFSRTELFLIKNFIFLLVLKFIHNDVVFPPTCSKTFEKEKKKQNY